MLTGNGKVNSGETLTLQSTLDDRTAAHLARLAQEAQSAATADTLAAPGEHGILLSRCTNSMILRNP